jgi:hypothetical protein
MAKKSKEFGLRLHGLINKCGLNVNKISKVVVVGPSVIWAYINEGRIPEAPILHRISLALGVTMEYLLTGEGERPKEPVTLDPRYPVALENLNEIFKSEQNGTINAICLNLDEFAGKVRLVKEVKVGKAPIPPLTENPGSKRSAGT